MSATVCCADDCQQDLTVPKRGDTSVVLAVSAGFSQQLQLLGISTVVANQTVDKVTDNALRVCEAAGLAHIGARVA